MTLSVLAVVVCRRRRRRVVAGVGVGVCCCCKLLIARWSAAMGHNSTVQGLLAKDAKA